MKNIDTYKLSVIVPCYNEESVINATYLRLKDVLRQMSCLHEIIFVNDGSTDSTLKILTSISSEDKTVVIINFSRNFGHQPAVTSAIHHCTGDFAAIIDADLQDPPEVIPQMVQKMLSENCNVVYGVRKIRKGETVFKKISAKLFYRILNSMSDVVMPVDTGDFRLIDKKVINTFRTLREKHKYIRGLITWVGFKQVPIFYDRDPRFAGETKYPLFKMLGFATRGLLYFTKRPLRIASKIGFFCIVIGLLLIFYTLFMKLYHPEHLVLGWASLLTIFIFFGGIQLFTIGVLGEYIGNIFDEVKERPEYIIESVITHADHELT